MSIFPASFYRISVFPAFLIPLIRFHLHSNQPLVARDRGLEAAQAE